MLELTMNPSLMWNIYFVDVWIQVQSKDSHVGGCSYFRCISRWGTSQETHNHWSPPHAENVDVFPLKCYQTLHFVCNEPVLTRCRGIYRSWPPSLLSDVTLVIIQHTFSGWNRFIPLFWNTNNIKNNIMYKSVVVLKKSLTITKNWF